MATSYHRKPREPMKRLQPSSGTLKQVLLIDFFHPSKETLLNHRGGLKVSLDGRTDQVMQDTKGSKSYTSTLHDEALKNYIKECLEGDPFKDTPHEGYKYMGAKQKGAYGEKYVEKVMGNNNHEVQMRINSGHDLIIDGYKTEIKFSLATNGLKDSFTVNHLSEGKDWVRFIFAGINVDGDNHMYWMKKDDFRDAISPEKCIFNHQQGGAKIKNDDYMITGQKVLKLKDQGIFRTMETWRD